MGQLIYLTGPVRSGKSRRAVSLASAWGQNVVFVATYRPVPGDTEMAERIRRHREERPTWRCLEAPRGISAELARLNPPPSGVVVDCLTLWASDQMSVNWEDTAPRLGEVDRSKAEDNAVVEKWASELKAFKAAPWPTVVVGNELGWSLVPETALLRRYRDLAGTLGQLTASAADEAWLLVAGCPVNLK